MEQRSRTILIGAATLLLVFGGCGNSSGSFHTVDPKSIRESTERIYHPFADDSTLACGFQLGLCTLDITFGHVFLSSDSRHIFVSGKIYGADDPVPGARIAVGVIGECEHGPEGDFARLRLRTSVTSDSCGSFIIEAPIEKSDKLIISLFSCIAYIFDLDSLNDSNYK